MPPAPTADFERIILDAARAGVAEHGYASLSMRQIAKAVGCSVGTIYLYYESKDALYGALVDEAVRHLIESYQPAFGIEDPVERLEAFCRSYVRFAVTYPEQYKLMYLELGLDPGRLAGYGRAKKPLLDTSQALAEAHEQGLLHSPSPMGAATFVWAALHGMLSLILARLVNPDADRERLIDLTIRQVINSFRCAPSGAE
jgi:AcrR family transcriptional regulator